MRPLMWLLLLSWALLPSFATAADDQIPALERLKVCDPKIALAAAEEIIKSEAPLREPSQLFSVAEILFAQGQKEEAVFWDWVGRLRSRYQWDIPISDSTAFTALLTRAVAHPINNYALQDTRRFDLILTRVLEWDRDNPNPFREKHNTEDGIKRVEEMYRSLNDFRMRIATQREELEHQARTAEPKVLEAHASTRKRQCRKELISRAQAERVVDLEKVRVVEFVRNKRDVINAVGAVVRADVGSYTLAHDQLLPYRYEVTVEGNKVAFAIIDVSRNTGDAEFVLACITHTSLWNRELPFKDPCNQ